MSVNKNDLTKIDKLIEAEKKYNSLRMAVLEFMTLHGRHGGAGGQMIDPYTIALDKLALSANIEFKNGTWILKEGE